MRFSSFFNSFFSPKKKHIYHIMKSFIISTFQNNCEWILSKVFSAEYKTIFQYSLGIEICLQFNSLPWRNSVIRVQTSRQLVNVLLRYNECLSNDLTSKGLSVMNPLTNPPELELTQLAVKLIYILYSQNSLL